MDEKTVGTDTWSIIEPKLLESVAVAFVWTEQTEWGDGVEKEIELAKKHGIYYLPLIEGGMNVPGHFKGDIEYLSFDPDALLAHFFKCNCKHKRKTDCSRQLTYRI